MYLSYLSFYDSELADYVTVDNGLVIGSTRTLDEMISNTNLVDNEKKYDPVSTFTITANF